MLRNELSCPGCDQPVENTVPDEAGLLQCPRCGDAMEASAFGRDGLIRQTLERVGDLLTEMGSTPEERLAKLREARQEFAEALRLACELRRER